MDQAIHDRVGEGRVVQVFVPVLDGQLTGHDRGTRADAIIEQLEQIVALARTDRADGEVIDDEQMYFGDGGETFAEAAVGMTEGEFLEQARSAHRELEGPAPGAL